MLTATLTYTPALIRRSTWAFVCRSFGKGGFVALGLVVVAGAYLVASQPGTLQTGIICGAAGVLSLLVVGSYFLHYRQGIAKLQRMGKPHAVIELTDAEFRVSSQAGTFSTPWSTFSALWQFKDFWLLIIGTNQFMTLPLDDLSPEVKAFISSRVGIKSQGVRRDSKVENSSQSCEP